MLTINNLSVYFTGRYIFNQVSFHISENERIGLVGKNGAGKTTLLRVITGLQEPENGIVTLKSGITVGYLPQEKFINSSKTIVDEAKSAFNELIDIKDKIDSITNEISTRNDHETESYLKLINKLNELNEHFNLLNGHAIDGEIEKILLGLGFKSSDFNRKITEFSGGWKMRVELAKLLLRKHEILLLDEPTNHLDIESIQWLESYLCDYKGAVILVSHDRRFLDKITNRTIEINLSKIYDYRCSYSEYVNQRSELIEQQMSSYTNQQKEIAAIEQFIERFRYKATKAKQVQSRIKMLEKMDLVQIDDTDTTAINFCFPHAPSSGKIVVEAINLTKIYGTNTVFENVNFIIEKGSFIAFVGKNGEGKSTLAKIIADNLQHDGICNLGHNVKIGYYAQNQNELLDENKTVFQTIDDVAVGEIRGRIRAILGSFLFQNDDIEKKVSVLSGGEKSRLSLAKLLLKPVNLLVLDEPTNHLDMISKDILKNALLKYDGTLIIVSHDRDFLQGLTQKVFEFTNKTVRQYFGDINEFLETKKISSLNSLNIAIEATGFNKNREETSSESKINYLQKKEKEREIRKITNKIEKCERDIEFIESEIEKLNNIFANTEKHSNTINDNNLFENYQELKTKLNKNMSIWEDLNNTLSDISSGSSAHL